MTNVIETNSAVIAVATSHARRRWRAIVLIGLVAGLVGGLVVASFTGARRTGTAYDRLVAASDFPDVFVQLIEPRTGLADDIDDLPSVERSVAASFVVGRHRDQRNQLLLPVQAAPVPIADFPVVRGRSADPAVVGEAVVSEYFGAAIGLEVGDTFPYQALTDAEFADLLRDQWEGSTSGPSVDLRIVGIVRSPTDFILSAFPTLIATPTYHERYARDADGASGVWVHLREGAARSAFASEIAALRGSEDPDRINGVEVMDLTEERDSLDDAVGMLVVGMLVFGAVTAIAGFVVVTQLVSRLADRDSGDDRVLGDLGLATRQRRAAAVLPGVGAVAIALVVSIGTAVALSQYTPVGAARDVEPSPGVEWNLAFVGTGAAAVALTTFLAWVVATRNITRRRSTRRPARAGGLAARLGGLSSGPVMGTAGNLAFGDGERSRSRRLAFLGVSAGVAGVVAAALFGASLDRLASEPGRWGMVGDQTVEVPDPVRADTYAALDEADEVDAYAEVRSGVVAIADRPVDAYSFEVRRGSMAPTILDGRVPAGPDEIALGPALLDDLGLAVGQAVDVDGEQLTVVGSVLTFGFADRSDHASGAMVGGPLSEPKFTTALVRFSDGVDPEQAAARIYGDLEYGPPVRPADVTNLAALEALPALLALVLAVVGFAAVTHTAIWMSNRSREDLAVLRALGVTRRHAARVVTAATAMIVITSGLIGGAVGVAIGRTSWTAIASSTDVATDLRVPPLVFVTPLVVLGAGWVLGAWAGRRAARAPVGDVLSAE